MAATKGETGKGRHRNSAMTLLLALGFVASILGAWAPAGAASGRAGGFELDVTFMDETGSTANVSDANSQINITVNVSIAAGMENVTDLWLLLDIDSGGIQAEEPVGALNEGEFAEHTFEWMPVVYGKIKAFVQTELLLLALLLFNCI